MAWRVVWNDLLGNVPKKNNVEESWGGSQAIGTKKESQAKVYWEWVSCEGKCDGSLPTHPTFKGLLEVLAIELYHGYTLLQQLNTKWNQKKRAHGIRLKEIGRYMILWPIRGDVTDYGCCQIRKLIGASHVGTFWSAHSQIPNSLRKAGIQHQPHDLC